MGSISFDVGALYPEGNISVKIRKVGQEYCEPRKKHEVRKWIDADTLHFVLFGHGTLVVRGEKYALTKGDIFLLYKNEEYEYWPDPIDPWSYTWIDFECSDTEALFARCGFSVEKPFLHLPDTAEFRELLKQFYGAYDASATQELTCSAFFMLLLNSLIRNADRSRAPAERTSGKFRRVRDILIYINNNYRMELSVQKIALDNCLSVSRLMALFSEVVGMSPVVYLHMYRVSAACNLLRGSNANIAEVSNAVGFEDPLYFSRIFRKYKGMNPRAYRKLNPTEDPFEWLKENNIDFR